MIISHERELAVYEKILWTILYLHVDDETIDSDLIPTHATCLSSFLSNLQNIMVRCWLV